MTNAEAVRRLLVLGLLCVGSYGCDLGGVAGAPVSAECTSIGARCQRSDGPIGVCQQTNCAPETEPPCYVCTPQH